MPLDANVQVRVDQRTLATIAKKLFESGNYTALKSASSLVRTCVEDYARILVAMEDAKEIQFSDEASEILQELGVFPRVVQTSHMRNRQDQTNIDRETGEEEPRHWRYNKPGREVREERTERGRLGFDVNNAEETERRIRVAARALGIRLPILEEQDNGTSDDTNRQGVSGQE